MRRPSRRFVPVLAFACALVTTGCGPTLSVDIGMKESQTKLQLGNQRGAGPVAARPALPTLPPNSSISPNFPGFVAPPSVSLPAAPQISFAAGPTPVAGCPDPAATATIQDAATTGIALPPAAPLTYTFRQRGSGSGAPFPPTMTMQVANVHRVQPTFQQTPNPQLSDNPTAEVWQFDTVIPGPSSTTTITYWIDPGTSTTGVNLQPHADADAGLKIAQISMKVAGDTQTINFTPSTPVKIFNIPSAEEPAGYNDAGADPLTGVELHLTHQTMKLVRKNACGSWIQAWEVSATAGLSSAKNLGLSLVIQGTYDIATQYGGLIVAEDLQTDGTGSDGQPFHQKFSATIDQVPAPEQSP